MCVNAEEILISFTNQFFLHSSTYFFIVYLRGDLHFNQFNPLKGFILPFSLIIGLNLNHSSGCCLAFTVVFVGSDLSIVLAFWI